MKYGLSAYKYNIGDVAYQYNYVLDRKSIADMWILNLHMLFIITLTCKVAILISKYGIASKDSHIAYRVGGVHVGE